MVEIVELPVIGQLVLGQPDADRIKGFAELRRAGGEIDAVKPDLDRRDAAPDPIHKAPAAHLVEHADFVDQPQRMIERQQIDHRPEPQLPGPLGHGGEKHARRRRVAERRVVVLGQMVAIEPGAIIGLDQLQPVLEMPGQRLPAVVQMVENPKTHVAASPCLLSPAARKTVIASEATQSRDARDRPSRLLRRFAPRNDVAEIHCATIASAIFSAVIKVGKLVLAHGTTGNSEASTTRSPPTPRTRP